MLLIVVQMKNPSQLILAGIGHVIHQVHPRILYYTGELSRERQQIDHTIEDPIQKL